MANHLIVLHFTTSTTLQLVPSFNPKSLYTFLTFIIHSDHTTGFSQATLSLLESWTFAVYFIPKCHVCVLLSRLLCHLEVSYFTLFCVLSFIIRITLLFSLVLFLSLVPFMLLHLHGIEPRSFNSSTPSVWDHYMAYLYG